MGPPPRRAEVLLRRSAKWLGAIDAFESSHGDCTSPVLALSVKHLLMFNVLGRYIWHWSQRGL